ncbi:MAG: phosphopantetheine-binding protein [Myxococcota bacterium]
MNREEIFEVIKSSIRLVIDGADNRDIVESDSMADYGADSLEIVEVVSRSMKETRIKVPRTELSTAENLGDLLDLFEKAQAS